MKEITLKRQLLYFMLFAKLAIIAYIWLNKNSGGLSSEQAIGAITLITPLFAVYLGIMYKELAKTKLKNPVGRPSTIPKSFRNLTFITVFVYVIAIISVVTLKASGTFSYNQFQTMLTAVESGFGVYVGQIIFSLFKNKDDKK